jgi:hypothetical protein
MMHVNFIYGVFVNGELEENTPFFRFSNVSRTVLQKSAADYIASLFTANTPLIVRAATTDTLIRLVQSYDDYERVIADIDPVNTYDIDCLVDDTVKGLSFNEIYEWALKCPFRLHDVYSGVLDDPITTIQKAVLATCKAL